jgi:uncharacterized NAD(P)/FAD-binding protein YdhS
MIKGKFTGKIQSVAGETRFEYVDLSTRQKHCLPVSIDAVFNCSGTRTLNELEPDSLLGRLIESNLCQPNDSNRGFHVDDQLQTSEGLYLIGPLLAGNIIKNLMIWHAEHCGRLIALASILAHALCQTFQDESCCSADKR